MTNKDESDLSVSSLNIWSKYRNNFFTSSSQREARLGTFLPSWIAILLKKNKKPLGGVSKCVSTSSTWRHPWSVSRTRDNSGIVLNLVIRFLSITGLNPATLALALLSSLCLSPPIDGLISVVCQPVPSGMFHTGRAKERSGMLVI